MIPESHLAQEAIAALVDGELPAGPAGRAARHLSGCASCRMAVAAQREAKDALHGSADVSVPGDLMSRLCAIPFTAPVPGPGDGDGSISAAAGELTVTGASGSWSVDLTEGAHRRANPGGRWFRRGVAGTLTGLGVGITALALTLPAGTGADAGTTAGTARPVPHTEVAPPVLRTITVDTSPVAGSPGGTP